MPREIQFSIMGSTYSYNCTISNYSNYKTMIVSGGEMYPVYDLSPNTTYSIDCIGGKDECLEANTTVTTSATGIWK